MALPQRWVKGTITGRKDCDMVDGEPFTTFQELLERRHLDPVTSAPVACAASRTNSWNALGEQRRTFFNGPKQATQQLVSLKQRGCEGGGARSVSHG